MILETHSRPRESPAGSAAQPAAPASRASGTGPPPGEEHPPPEVFDALMQAVRVLHSPILSDEGLQRVAAANRDALANHRLTGPDLQHISERLGRRDRYLKTGLHLGRHGAVAVARGRMGMGELAGLLRPPPAASARPAASGLIQAPAALAPPVAGPQGAASDAASARVPGSAAQSGGGVPADPAPGAADSALRGAANSAAFAAGRAAASPAPAAPNVPPAPARAPASAPDRGAALAVRTASAAPVHEMLPASGGRPGDAPGGSRGDSPPAPTEQSRAAAAGDAKTRSAARADDSPRPASRPLDDVLRVIRSNLRPGNSTIRMQLTPPQLGRVLIELRLEGDRVHLDIQAHTPEAGELLRAGGTALADLLHAQGLIVEHYDVTVSSADGGFANGDCNGPHPEGHSSERSPAHPAGEGQRPESDPSIEDGVQADATVLVDGRLDVRA